MFCSKLSFDTPGVYMRFDIMYTFSYMRPVKQRGCGVFPGKSLREEVQLRIVSSDDMAMGKPGIDVTPTVRDAFSILLEAADPLTIVSVSSLLHGSVAEFLNR